MVPAPGETQKVDLDCPLAGKTIGMIQKCCEVFDTHNAEQKCEWINDICLNRLECEKKSILCRYATRLYSDPNPFKSLEI
jgi:hypothetical protein